MSTRVEAGVRQVMAAVDEQKGYGNVAKLEKAMSSMDKALKVRRSRSLDCGP